MRPRCSPGRLLGALLLGVPGLLAGCGEDPLPAPPALETRIDVDNPELRSAKDRIGVEPCPEPTPGSVAPASELPVLTLPCLGGGPDVALAELEGPAVISLWASWCPTCPDELPLFQRLSDEAGDRLTVLGVDYQDTQPGAALQLLEQTGAVYPQLADPGGQLADHYRVAGLPGLILVDEQGSVTFLLRRVDSYAELTGLVGDHTGVTVAAG